MTRQKVEMIFSLIFFFFASFLFVVIISSEFVPNFDNLLPILLKPSGFFVTLSRILLFCGIILSIYLFFQQSSNKKYRQFGIFGIFMFIALLSISILSSISDNELEKMINLYNYKESNLLIENIKRIIIDSVVFAYFILIPAFSFFNKKRFYDNYFYKTYLQEIAPSLNTSIIFLFGYSIETYSVNNVYSVIDLGLSIIFIIVFLRIAFALRDSISFYTIMNMLVLIIGFIIFLCTSDILLKGNLYYIGIFFYCIGLLYWFLNISLKLKL